MREHAVFPDDEQLKVLISGLLSGRPGYSDWGQARVMDITPENLILFLEHEGVSALLMHCLRERGKADYFPEAINKGLRQCELESVAFEMRRRYEVEEVFSGLQRHNLEFIVLKGEALANSIYPAAYTRSRGDIDLLFRDKPAAEAAWEVLSGQGFRRANTLEGKFVGYQYACGKKVSASLTLVLDVHNQISDYVWFARQLPYSELLSSSQQIPWSSLKVRIPCRPHALIHACFHRVCNKPLGIQDRLIWLYDIHLLCESFGQQDWEFFLELAGGKEVATVCLQGIERSRHYFYTDMPAAFLDELVALADDEPAGFALGSSRSALYFQDFLHNRGGWNKFLQLREHLFPSTTYMMKKYGVGSKWLLPYYYLKRIILGVFKFS